MDNIIFENPSQPRKKKVSSHFSVPVARCDPAIEQARGPIEPYFSYDINFDLHAQDKEPVSLYEIFSLSGDEEMENEDLINRSPQALSPGNMNGEPEWAVSGTGGSAEDVIPIDPAILEEDNVREKNGDKNPAPGFSGSFYPTSPISLALHGQAQIVGPPTPVSNANSEPERLPSKRQRSNETHCDNPRKQFRSGSLPAKDQQCTLHSCFSAAPLHERLDFLAWLFKTGLSESLSAASVELPSARVKTADPCIKPTRSKHRRPRTARNRAGPTSTKSRKNKAWEHEEEMLLMQLKKDGLPWSVIARKFEERFPGRTQGTIQVKWSKDFKHLH